MTHVFTVGKCLELWTQGDDHFVLCWQADKALGQQYKDTVTVSTEPFKGCRKFTRLGRRDKVSHYYTESGAMTDDRDSTPNLCELQLRQLFKTVPEIIYVKVDKHQ